MRSDEAGAEVSVQDAYAAAVERSQRTHHALILAEAQLLHWKRMYLAESDRAERAEREAERLKREADGRGRDAEGDPVGYAGAVGQAD
jgi:hypothetical protein